MNLKSACIYNLHDSCQFYWLKIFKNHNPAHIYIYIVQYKAIRSLPGWTPPILCITCRWQGRSLSFQWHTIIIPQPEQSPQNSEVSKYKHFLWWLQSQLSASCMSQGMVCHQTFSPCTFSQKSQKIYIWPQILSYIYSLCFTIHELPFTTLKLLYFAGRSNYMSIKAWGLCQCA